MRPLLLTFRSDKIEIVVFRALKYFIPTAVVSLNEPFNDAFVLEIDFQTVETIHIFFYLTEIQDPKTR